MALLDRIRTGRLNLPVRLIVHGPGGIGKSTFAAGAPRPLFFDIERRSNFLDVARFEPVSWPEVVNGLAEARTSTKYDTIVLDTLDHLELLIWNHLMEQYKAASIEAVGGGYGKGYKLALTEWQRLMTYVEQLRAAGKNTVMLAHSQIRTFKNPGGEDYDVWSLKLHEAARAFLREKADAVGYAGWEDGARKNPSLQSQKAKAITTGERELHFGHDPAFETKSGFELPDAMDFTWTVFQSAVDKFYGKEA